MHIVHYSVKNYFFRRLTPASDITVYSPLLFIQSYSYIVRIKVHGDTNRDMGIHYSSISSGKDLHDHKMVCRQVVWTFLSHETELQDVLQIAIIFTNLYEVSKTMNLLEEMNLHKNKNTKLLVLLQQYYSFILFYIFSLTHLAITIRLGRSAVNSFYLLAHICLMLSKINNPAVIYSSYARKKVQSIRHTI